MKEPTRAPFYACIYPGLCDVARSHGYALAIHGTVTTDLDLVAIPWIDDAAAPEVLKDALMAHIGACGYADLLRRDGLCEDHVQQITARPENANADYSPKPHGRRAWLLYMGAGAQVDLSIMPRGDIQAVLAACDEVRENVERICHNSSDLDFTDAERALEPLNGLT